MTTTVEVLAQAFNDAGTPFIVGHPGGESVELMEAARQRQMRFLLMKQEVAGAMLAATWGEITGSPGICMSTRGPGATNMVNGVAHAFLDRSPLIAITDAYSRPTYEIGLRQRINQLALYEPIVKWSTTIDAKTVRQQVRRAMRTATAEPPGPVHFELPQSETTREAGDYIAEPPLCRTGSRRDRTAPISSPSSTRCGAARRPILLAGLGVFWSKASPEFVAFAEKLGAPVLTTSKCKGAIPEDHPLRAGCIIGGIIEKQLVTQADLIITVGLDAVELQPKAWPYTLPVISLASTPSLDAFVPADPGDRRRAEGAARRARASWRRKAPAGARRPPNLPPAGGRRAQYAGHRAFAAARHGGRARGAAARHDRDLRRRREPPAGGAEMGGLRAARIPHLERPRLHGLCDPRRAGGAARASRTGRSSPSPATAAS